MEHPTQADLHFEITVKNATIEGLTNRAEILALQLERTLQQIDVLEQERNALIEIRNDPLPDPESQDLTTTPEPLIPPDPEPENLVEKQ